MLPKNTKIVVQIFQAFGYNKPIIGQIGNPIFGSGLIDVENH